MPWAEAFIKAQHSSSAETGGERQLSYAEALHEALDLAMELDPNVFVIGQGADTPPNGMFGVTRGFWDKYGHDRCIDSPLSEAAITGVCTGAAMAGMRPVYLHNRPDFLYLAMDQLANHAAKIHYMDAGKSKVPMVIWAPIARGWGSGSQHSQALQGLMIGIPGIKIIAPSTPYDAKGLLLSAIADNNPVLFFDHRFVMRQSGPVPAGLYQIPIGQAVYRERGSDLTLVGSSHTLLLAQQALSQIRQDKAVSADVIDLRTLKPLDEGAIIESVQRTGRLVVVDTGWNIGGVTAEIAALAAEHCYRELRAPVKRIGLPDAPTPAGYSLEQAYYPTADSIRKTIEEVLSV